MLLIPKYRLTFPKSRFSLQSCSSTYQGARLARDTTFHFRYNIVAVGILPKTYMPILRTASVQDLKRLLELYPVSSLRERWSGIAGTKDELCLEVAGKRNLKDIAEFVNDYLSCCKQHIYVYSHRLRLNSLPTVGIPDGELLDTKSEPERVHLLYLIRVGFKIIVRDPPEEATVEFLLPVRLDVTREHLIVRIVVLEKDIGSYVDGRGYNTIGRSIDENGILLAVERAFGGALVTTDLHKGVKKLWHDDFMDATRAQYKKPKSTDATIMDKSKGIKKTDSELYALLRTLTLFKTLFEVTATNESSVSAFSVDPGNGYIGFPRYSDNRGDTDHVVDEILKHNR